MLGYIEDVFNNLIGRLLVKRMNHAYEVQRKSNEALDRLMDASSG